MKRHDNIVGCIIAVFFIAITSAKAAESWQEPEDFRGLKWGASVEEMREMFPAAHDTISLGNRIKSFRVNAVRIGDASVYFDLGFLDGRFSSANVNFKSNDFNLLRERVNARSSAKSRPARRLISVTIGSLPCCRTKRQ